MLSHKRALIGQILLGVLAVIILLGAILGITAYQAYSFYKVIQQEGTSLNENILSLQEKENCSKIPAIESSSEKLKSEAFSACKNPIIKIIVEKTQQIPIKCGDLNSLSTQLEASLISIKEYCNQENLSFTTP